MWGWGSRLGGGSSARVVSDSIGRPPFRLARCLALSSHLQSRPRASLSARTLSSCPTSQAPSPTEPRQLTDPVISILAITPVVFPASFVSDLAPPGPIDDGLPPPTDARARLLGLGLGSLCLLFAALDFFCLRLIGARVDPAQTLTTYAAAGLVLPAGWVLVSASAFGSASGSPSGSKSTVPALPAPADWPLLALLVLCGTAAQLFETAACATLPGATAAMLGYSGVLWGAGYQTALYGNVPSGPAMLGMAVVVGAGVVGAGAGDGGEQGTGRKERRGRGADEECTLGVPLLTRGTETGADSSAG